ncbi:4-(cytidine 5'-diphospho)-2-C-methyl-D-erythritol kinase [Micromonospora sp. NPDC048835]|uniref:4-(cytidine 5'-diphospho)-2-C-methyl-D-erythritol kinase n=1 Tax=Micromonospora sp. NPDC048835 TaxID=3155147 RepID=UPI0033DC1146
MDTRLACSIGQPTREHGAPLVITAPGKVNLHLSIGPLRSDGYHELVTLFHAVSLADEVVLTKSEQLVVTAEGEGADRVPLDETNLAARAAQLLAREIGVAPNVHLHLRKRIPVAGGMAGGSADAAATLVGCDSLWGANLPTARLLDLAAELGSDVPFTLLGGTATGLGRGEKLTPVGVAGALQWVFAVAKTGLSTPAVYQESDRLRKTGRLGPGPALSQHLLDALSAGDVRAVGAALHNDAEPAVYSLRPELRQVLRVGKDAGAIAGLISGTGPTCAFLVEDLMIARRVESALTTSLLCRKVRVAHGPVLGPLAMREALQRDA